MKKEERIFYNNRGQFYLMVSMILVATIAGMLSIHNMAKEKPTSKIGHLEEEMETESEYVLDYYINTGDGDVFDTFTRNYSDYFGKDTRAVYILENETSDLEVFEYNFSTGNKVHIDYYDSDYDSSSGKGEINVPLNSTNYTFDMKDGKDFYFIITKESFGEKHVVTNQN